MKYVRVKDGIIYEKSKVFVTEENGVEIVLLGISDDFIERTRGKTWNCGTNVIVKQANTIEELCDELVIKMDGECITRRTMLELKDMNNYVQAIYGAIWTDKGLIYVAKMNDKGELELL